MKIRSGFVTNSSSSSFVLVFDGKMPFGTRTKTELNKWYDDYDEDELSEMQNYDKYAEMVKSGKTLVRGSAEFGSEDSIRDLAKQLNATVIWEEL